MRLSRNADFRSVIDKRLRWSNGLLTVFRAANPGAAGRVGISIGRKAGGAVSRNRLKRLIRQSWRLRQEQLPAGWDHVVMINPQRAREDCVEFGQIDSSIEAYYAWLFRKQAEEGRGIGT